VELILTIDFSMVGVNGENSIFTYLRMTPPRPLGTGFLSLGSVGVIPLVRDYWFNTIMCYFECFYFLKLFRYFTGACKQLKYTIVLK